VRLVSGASDRRRDRLASRMARVRRPGRLLRAVMGALLIAIMAGPVGSGGAARPGLASGGVPCFGAASRDRVHRCNNPRLRLSVWPTPSEALITPNALCRPLTVEPVSVCTFGVQKRRSRGAVVLLGDSHAEHWRAAVEVVARANRWRGLSMTHASCPFSAAVRRLQGRARTQCLAWKRGVLREFARHPEASTVFVSETSGGKGVEVRRGGREFATEVRGYLRAWRELPVTVRHILVIRDTPKVQVTTFDCIRRAVKSRRAPGPACALPRATALDPDPAAVAASRYDADRAQLVDLTYLFCDRRVCYPVVGGALVYKDTTHLTRVFAASAGPALTRAVTKLMAHWCQPAVASVAPMRGERCPAPKTSAAASVSGSRSSPAASQLLDVGFFALEAVDGRLLEPFDWLLSRLANIAN
jgi:SGNH domain (fused to AT3 domains)